jgi:hypothetical protein
MAAILRGAMDVDWTPDELWQQEQSNFSAHLAMMFGYLVQHGLPTDEFVRFVGERSAPSWEGTEGVADLMEGILLNVRSNGHEIVSVEMHDNRARATVTGLVRYDVMEFFGVPREQADAFWDKFHPLAEALGLSFTWQRIGDGAYEVEVTPGG